jgi:hypothetical protein
MCVGAECTERRDDAIAMRAESKAGVCAGKYIDESIGIR